MTDLFAPRMASPQPFIVNKAHLRGVIWLMALALFVLLPRPDAADAPRPLLAVEN